MENEQGPEVTVRIEEGKTAPPDQAAEVDNPNSKTQVVFMRNPHELSAAYHQGFHDGCNEFSLVVLLLSMAVTFLSFVLVRNATE